MQRDCMVWGVLLLRECGENIVADGGGMTLQIEKPVVDDSGGGDIRLERLQSMASATRRRTQRCRNRFQCRPDQWGDNDPHLFVITGTMAMKPATTSATGFRSATPTTGHGSIFLVASRSTSAGLLQGAWWAWFNDQWLASFGLSVDIHHAGFQHPMYGESPRTMAFRHRRKWATACCNIRNAAAMSTLCDVIRRPGSAPSDLQGAGATQVNYYNIVNHSSFGAVRYAGPIAIEGILNLRLLS